MSAALPFSASQAAPAGQGNQPRPAYLVNPWRLSVAPMMDWTKVKMCFHWVAGYKFTAVFSADVALLKHSAPESFWAADAGTMPTDICGNLVDAWMKRASDACDRRWRVTQGPVLGLRVISRLLMQLLRSLRTHPSPNP